MQNGIESELSKTLQLARIAQARDALEASMLGRNDAKLMADAVIKLARRLDSISIEEKLLVSAKTDPVGYMRHLKELADYAERFEYLSPYDLDHGDALAAIKKL